MLAAPFPVGKLEVGKRWTEALINMVSIFVYSIPPDVGLLASRPFLFSFSPLSFTVLPCLALPGLFLLFYDGLVVSALDPRMGKEQAPAYPKRQDDRCFFLCKIRCTTGTPSSCMSPFRFRPVLGSKTFLEENTERNKTPQNTSSSCGTNRLRFEQ